MTKEKFFRQLFLSGIAIIVSSGIYQLTDPLYNTIIIPIVVTFILVNKNGTAVMIYLRSLKIPERRIADFRSFIIKITGLISFLNAIACWLTTDWFGKGHILTILCVNLSVITMPAHLALMSNKSFK